METKVIVPNVPETSEYELVYIKHFHHSMPRSRAQVTYGMQY